MARDTKKDYRNMTMYSIYVRNHSSDGSFKAVAGDIERIKNLGVDIIWLMPVHPIGKMKRKGTMGSPYAIQDYRKINPELGTLEEFKALVDEIHKFGMKCIIDVVYNHTSPDSWLAENHPEFFRKQPDGSLGSHNEEWDDIIDLDYSNRDLWEYQINTLKMWAEIVDGFRCDVAPLIPQMFWELARNEVAKIRADCFWLSESVEPGYILYNRLHGRVCLSDSEIFQTFDAAYDYDIYHEFTGALRGDNGLERYIDAINRQEYIYPDNYVKLRFLENHDRERAKAVISNDQARINWTAFLYFQKGMTLLYAGQEVENEHTPDLFNQDVIDWNTGRDISTYLQKLYLIKKESIMAEGQYKVELKGSDIIHASYHLPDSRIDGYFRINGDTEMEVETDLPDGTYTNRIDDGLLVISNQIIKINQTPIIIK